MRFYHQFPFPECARMCRRLLSFLQYTELGAERNVHRKRNLPFGCLRTFRVFLLILKWKKFFNHTENLFKMCIPKIKALGHVLWGCENYMIIKSIGKILETCNTIHSGTWWRFSLFPSNFMLSEKKKTFLLGTLRTLAIGHVDSCKVLSCFPFSVLG